MTAYNSPPGITVDEDPISIGRPDVLVPHPDVPTVFAFTSPPGVSQRENEPCPAAPLVGQWWPR